LSLGIACHVILGRPFKGPYPFPEGVKAAGKKTVRCAPHGFLKK